MANIQRFSVQMAQTLRDRGYSYKNIAIEMGCSEAWVAKALRGYGKGFAADVNGTKVQALQILEDALEKIRCL